jgi:hypothetical protein
MREVLGITLALGLVLAAPAASGADEHADAMALIDRAIQALGGRQKLAQLPACSWKSKGHFEVQGMNIPYTSEVFAQGQDQYHWDLDLTVQGRQFQASLVLNGGKGWLKGNGRTQDAPREIVTLLREDFQAIRIAQRLLPLKEKGFKLSPLGELKIGDRAALGVKVCRKGFQDVDLFLDKQTLLPVKASLRLKEGKDGQEVVHDFLFSDYKKVNGLQHFGKIEFRRDDKLFIKMALTEITPEEKLDDSVFAKP